MLMGVTTPASTNERMQGLVASLVDDLLSTPRRALAYQDIVGTGVTSVATAVMQVAFVRFLERNISVSQVQILDNYANRQAWTQLAATASFPASKVRYLTPLNVAGNKTPIDPALPMFANGDALTFDKKRALWKVLAEVWPKMERLYVSVPITNPRLSIHMVELVAHFDKALYVYPETLNPARG